MTALVPRWPDNIQDRYLFRARVRVTGNQALLGPPARPEATEREVATNCRRCSWENPSSEPVNAFAPARVVICDNYKHI